MRITYVQYQVLILAHGVKVEVFFQAACQFLESKYICDCNLQGTLAQLVEQRTENPCVPGSIPGGTTKNPQLTLGIFLYFTYP